MSEAGTDDTLAADTLAGSAETTKPRGIPRRLDRGTLIGRHVVLGTLGAGGMGVVYAAHDPELDRKLALKMLLPREGGGSNDARARLHREAQALAKLSHPNVVAVHDVGEHEGQVWLAMEFVNGVTLRSWSEAKPRSWHEVLGVMKAAGLGLEAAHAAGLLHRDFKPDNVMVGDDGRVRVMDLGLARASSNLGDTTDVDGAVQPLESGVEPLARDLTATGSIMGTPSYMAPEQLRGDAVDARADQFAFCVTLWEALYGQRPHAGETLAELCRHVIAGSLRPPPANTRVPRWLHRVCLRGLATEREDRFPSMHALASALEAGQRRRRAVGVLLGVSCLPLLIGAALGWGRIDEARRVASCEADGRAIETAWNDDARAQVRSGLTATGVRYAATTADKVLPWLDDYATSWSGYQTDACVLARVEHEWDEDMYARASWCLEDRRLTFEALVSALGTADEILVTRAVNAVASLRDAGTCLDATTLERLPVPPSDVRPKLVDVRTALSNAAALEAAGRYEPALELLESLEKDATALEWSPLVAAAAVRKGVNLHELGRYDEAEATLQAAFVENAKLTAWDQALEASVRLSDVVGYRLNRALEGERWSAMAEFSLALAGDPHGLREALRLYNLALVHQGKGDFDQARILHERALALREKGLTANDPAVASSLAGLGAVHYQLGDYDAARASYERSLQIKKEALGEDHPNIASSFVGVASADYSIGDHAAAMKHYGEAIRVMENAYGAEHPDIALVLSNLAAVQSEMGDLETAEKGYERARGIIEAKLGPDHRLMGMMFHNLGSLHSKMGQLDRAKAELEQALTIKEKAHGADHPDVASTLVALSEVSAGLDLRTQARAYQERALAITEAKLGPDHPDLAHVLHNLGTLHEADGEHERARDACERAADIFRREPGVQPIEPQAYLCAARALRATRGDETRVLSLAREAEAASLTLGPGAAEGLADARAFIEKHTPRAHGTPLPDDRADAPALGREVRPN